MTDPIDLAASLRTLADYLADHPDATAPIASVRTDGLGFVIQLSGNHRAELIDFGATLDKPAVTVEFYLKDSRIARDWFAVNLHSTVSNVPLRVWASIDADVGDTEASVAAAFIAELAAVAAK